MKESEAKNKWCPMFRNTATNDRGGSNNNRADYGAQFDSSPRCIASDCMMWIVDTVDCDEKPIGGHCGLSR
jgi:hypothetical protein